MSDIDKSIQLISLKIQLLQLIAEISIQNDIDSIDIKLIEIVFIINQL